MSGSNYPHEMKKDSTVLVTGGAGSFGKTMVSHILESDLCSEVRVYSRDENKQEHMRIDFNDPRLRFYIGDVRDAESVNNAMRGVDYVFHAAALKQVPSCEFFPLQAVQTNVLGSSNVLNAAVDNNVKSVVCLSTDKAVFPINAMGMSKAMMEKVVQSKARVLGSTDTRLSCVRYGNVMYSRGSVIPLFIKCILNKKPITITAPKMTRFLMSLADSVDLVKYAFANANQGDIFIRKAPASTVGDLATALCELFQYDAERHIIGIRHGEKLNETLASSEELSRSDDKGDYFQVSMDSRDLNYKKYFSEGDINLPEADYTSDNTKRLNVEEIKSLLLTLPEVQHELVKAGITTK